MSNGTRFTVYVESICYFIRRIIQIAFRVVLSTFSQSPFLCVCVCVCVCVLHIFGWSYIFIWGLSINLSAIQIFIHWNNNILNELITARTTKTNSSYHIVGVVQRPVDPKVRGSKPSSGLQFEDLSILSGIRSQYLASPLNPGRGHWHQLQLDHISQWFPTAITYWVCDFNEIFSQIRICCRLH